MGQQRNVFGGNADMRFFVAVQANNGNAELMNA